MESGVGVGHGTRVASQLDCSMLNNTVVVDSNVFTVHGLIMIIVQEGVHVCIKD